MHRGARIVRRGVSNAIVFLRANPEAGRDGGKAMEKFNVGVLGVGDIRETLINEPVVRITDEAGCNFQIDVG
ncbi:hypothetical protein, partial [Burkholderia multivorans]|uniref:hypothetical protein n=1 Tax=Burkholderia multivorans TaxID=87883 RepID=UPI0019D211FE